MNRIVMPLPGTVEDPRYPDSDGRFMGDTQFHNLAMRQICEALEVHFAQDPHVLVASNIVMYWKEGDARARKDPDVLIAKGVVAKHKRRSFRVWEEGTLPCVLFEVASRRTWRNDVGEKRLLYACLGIKEYFVFDPEGRYVKPMLQGFRTSRGRSIAIKSARDGSVVSKELGLMLSADGDRLRMINQATGEELLTPAERADRETELADALAEEVARLRALLGKSADGD